MNNKAVRCILRLKKHNISDVERLHATVYNKKLSDISLSRKYDTAYTGIEYVGFLAYNNDMMPIAFYGVIPCFASISGSKVLAAQSADTMTHPEYQGMGLFTQLAEQTYELCRNLGINFIFGFPNQNSLPGFINKLGWQVQETMARFSIPVKALPLERLANKFPLLKPVHKSYKNKLLYTTTTRPMKNPSLKAGFDGLVRDDDYMRYKGYANTCLVQVGDVPVWLKACGSLQIGDMDVNEDNFKPTMDKLLSLTAKLGLNSLHFHCSPGTPIYELFAARYQPEASFPIIFKDLGKGFSFDKMKFTFADIDIF